MRRTYFTTAALAAVLLLVFYEHSLRAVGWLLVENNETAPADAILVLGGDFYGSRVRLAADLASIGLAKRVLISGPIEGRVSESDLAIRFLTEKGYPRDLFVSCPNDASSTIDEVFAFAPVFKRLGISRVILVTSSYHSRRAGLLFRSLLGDVRFHVVAAPDENFDPDAWWKTPVGRRIVASEWAKMAWNLGVRFWPARFLACFL